MMVFKRLWLFSYLFVIMLFEFSLTVPVVQQKQQNKDINSRTSPDSDRASNNILISDNSISTKEEKQIDDSSNNNNNPPLYPSPGLDLEQDLIGTSTQDILGRVGTATATCLVAGIEYTHGQQIYRADQCEFCLCLDGEMFCWWQECPPTIPEIPCRDRFPFSGPPCNYPQVNDVSPFSSPYFQPSSPNQPSNSKGTTELDQQQSSSSDVSKQHIETSTNMLILNKNNNTTTISSNLDTKNKTTTNSSNSNVSTVIAPSVVTNESLSTSSSSSLSMLTLAAATTTNENSTQQAASISTITSLDGLSETTILTTTTVPTVCVVMGIEYKIGEILPHDTGNCLQCVCSDGARVTCSPYQCAPSEEDEDLEDGVPPLYRPSSGRRSDVDLF